MKTEKSILIAFILNLSFAFFEFIGGIFTGSVAIISDAVHDLGDAMSIGVSFILEKKSKRQPNEIFTYGYARYSVVGGVISTLILLFGSVTVVLSSVLRILKPVEINYNGMIAFAIVGVIINLIASLATRKGESLNQRAINLHMLEDVLGWAVVLIGAIIMRFTDLKIIDPLMSIGVSVFIVISAVKNLKAATDLLLEKSPNEKSVSEIKSHLSKISGVLEVHHVHVWRLDENNIYATMHVVADGDAFEIKEAIRETLSLDGIHHVTLELENENEECHNKHCHINLKKISNNHHHH